MATWLRGYGAKQEGFHTNKIESRWRQMKAKLPTPVAKKNIIHRI